MSQAKESAAPTGVRDDLEGLIYKFAAALDRFDFAEAVGLFTDDCTYQVIPRINYERGSVLYAVDDDNYKLKARCETHPVGQLEKTMHVVGNVVAEPTADDKAEMSASFIVNRNGKPLFNGEYRANLRKESDSWKFANLLVLLEGDSVPAYIVVPI